MCRRPYKAPAWIIGIGAALSFVNVIFMGAGAKVWNPAGTVGGADSGGAHHPPSSPSGITFRTAASSRTRCLRICKSVAPPR